jgi:predicted metalloprotease
MGRLFIVMMIVMGLSLPALDHAAAQDGSNAESGVRGNSYTSPTFGYSLTWSGEWEVAEETVGEDGTDALKLTNGVSNVWFEGYSGDQTPAECLEQSISGFDTNDGIEDFAQLEGEDGPLGGESEGRAWGAYSFKLIAEDEEIELAIYLDCRTVEPGASFVVITQVVAADEFEAEVEPLVELIQSLDVSGGGEPPVEATPTTGYEGEVDDMTAFIRTTTRDVEAFWANEFALVSGGAITYRPLTEIVTFDGEVESACGTFNAGEVGPFYCSFDETMYYDLVYAEQQMVDFQGSRTVVLAAVAHEVGHHVQTVMEWQRCLETPCFDPGQMTTLERENQADCFAGAYFANAEGRGRLGSMDVELNILQFSFALADPNASETTADLGAHGSGPQRAYWFLGGYYRGVGECLTASPVTDPAFNGQDITNEPDAGATGDLNDAGDEPVVEPAAIGDEVTLELDDAMLSMTVTGTELTGELEGLEPEGEYLIVYATVQFDAAEAGPLPYENFMVTDGNGDEVSLDDEATDALLLTAFEDGLAEDLDPDASYNVAFVFDIEPGSEDFVFSAVDGDAPVALDI